MDFISGETLYIDKPHGWTSFDVVKRLRSTLIRRMKVKKLKVGHAGTLDPLATGVMIVVTGRSTKLIEQLQAGVKEYIATIALGATTPSFDLETEIDATYPTGHITRELVEQTLPQFVGTIRQVPPAFSACKIEGQRAYSMARRGEEVEIKAKTLVIEAIELLDFSPQSITLRVVCSKGTYIRALARDIGRARRRTRVGEIPVTDCLTVDQAVELIRSTDITYPDDWLASRRPPKSKSNETNDIES